MIREFFHLFYLVKIITLNLSYIDSIFKNIIIRHYINKSGINGFTQKQINIKF